MKDQVMDLEQLHYLEMILDMMIMLQITEQIV